MSLLSSVILPHLEKQLVALEPAIADFILKEIHVIGSQLISYVEGKLGANPHLPVEDKSEEN